MYEIEDYWVDKKTGHHVVTFRVLNEEVDTFPIHKGTRLVTEAGDKAVTVLDVSWFYPSSIPTPRRGVGLALDGPLARFDRVKIVAGG